MRSHKAFDYRAANNIVKLNEIDIRFGIENGFLENVKNYPDIETFDISISKKKWLLISISLSILENENNLEELFREVDYILADFEYPDSANNLLSFFPADDPDSSPGCHLTRIKKFCSDLKDDIDKQKAE